MASHDEIAARIQNSLNGGSYACNSLTKLTGGTANFLYRANLDSPLSDGSRTIIIKHTEGYSASNPNFKLTATRCNFEQLILASLSTFLPSTHANITITTPHLYFFDPTANIQIHSDLPASTELKTYCLTHPITPQDCSQLGASLGLWAKKFHTWGAAPEQATLREEMAGNTAMRDLKYQINYPYMVVTVNNFPEILGRAKAIFEEVASDVRGQIERGDGTLIHGDFWSGNVLLPNKPFPSLDNPLDVFVIDWELSHIGSPAWDLGQMFAELYELKHFKDIDAGSLLIDAFMKGYGQIDEKLAFKVAIHFGAHLICWGSRVPGWGTKEHIEGVVGIGRDFVVSGWKKDRVWLSNSVLGCLF